MRLLKVSAFAVAATLLGGCALKTIYEGRYDFDEGWRKGKVLEVATAQGLAGFAFEDCRKKGTPRPAETRYALVEYRSNRLARRIVPLAAGQDLKAGDLVYTRVKDCEAPIPPRVE